MQGPSDGGLLSAELAGGALDARLGHSVEEHRVVGVRRSVIVYDSAEVLDVVDSGLEGEVFDEEVEIEPLLEVCELVLVHLLGLVQELLAHVLCEQEEELAEAFVGVDVFDTELPQAVVEVVDPTDREGVAKILLEDQLSHL